MNQLLFFIGNMLTGPFLYPPYFGILEQFLRPTAFIQRWKLLYILVCSLVHTANYMFFPLQWRWAVSISLYAILPLVFFRGHLAVKALLYLFYLTQMVVFEAIAVHTLQIFGWNPVLIEYSFVPILLNLFLALCAFVMLQIARSVRSILTGRMDRLLLICLGGSLSVISVAMLHIYFSMDIMNMAIDPNRFNAMRTWLRSDAVGLYVGLLLMMGLPFLLTGIVRRMEARARATREAALSLRRAQYELLGYRDAIASEARMRRFRHDMRGHLAALQAMARSGEREREAAYIGELIAGLQEEESENGLMQEARA